MLVVFLATTALAASAPCLHPLSSTATPRLFAPRDGATDVPLNSRILIVGATDLLLEDESGGPISFETSALAIEHGFTPPIELQILTPESELDSESAIVVKAGDETLGTFRTGADSDSDAPPIPDSSLVGPFSDGACPPYVEFDVVQDAETAFVIASLSGDDRVAGLSLDSQLIVAGPARETRAVELRAVDLAGNTSAAALSDATFPPEFNPGGCGCASSRQAGSAGLLTAFAFASLLLAARRRFPSRRNR